MPKGEAAPGSYSDMKETKVKLNSIDDVKNFVTAATQFITDIDVVGGRYIIDAKSILGLFSLDLAKPLTLQIHDDEEAPQVEEAMSEWIVTD